MAVQLQCGLIKTILQDINNGLPIMFVRRIILDLLIQHSMKRTRIANMFKRSIIKNNLRYTNYTGDGDSSAFNTIK